MLAEFRAFLLKTNALALAVVPREVGDSHAAMSSASR
jgi:hypothetical protein